MGCAENRLCRAYFWIFLDIFAHERKRASLTAYVPHDFCLTTYFHFQMTRCDHSKTSTTMHHPRSNPQTRLSPRPSDHRCRCRRWARRRRRRCRGWRPRLRRSDTVGGTVRCGFCWCKEALFGRWGLARHCSCICLPTSEWSLGLVGALGGVV